MSNSYTDKFSDYKLSDLCDLIIELEEEADSYFTKKDEYWFQYFETQLNVGVKRLKKKNILKRIFSR